MTNEIDSKSEEDLFDEDLHRQLDDETSDDFEIARDEDPRHVERPTIRLGVDVARVTDEAIAALRSDPEIFVRSGALTRVIASDGTELDAIKREIGAPVMRRATAAWVRERLSIHARFVSEKSVGRGNKKRFVEADAQPPIGIAIGVVDRGTWPGYRSIVGVVTSPTMRADGSILQTPGYDEATSLLYLPHGEYSEIVDAPTRADALHKRDELLDVILDFPLSLLGRASWLALVFTLVARDLIEGRTPLFAADAPVPGAGKGLLFRSAHVIATGLEVAHMSLPPNEEEFRKQITTTLLSGDPAILLDNISVCLGGDSLDAILTAPVWKVRILGRNEDSGSLIPRLVWLATGNGLEFIGDLGRRTLRIRLDSPHENPEERDDFTRPERKGEDKFMAWVRANRPRLVIAALTILRAWHVAGRLGVVRPWGSFESWSSTIARCVQWLDLPDPSEGRATKDIALDPARRALAIVYDAIGRIGGETGVTAGDLIRAAYPRPNDPPTGEDALAEAIAELVNAKFDDKSKARALGRKLKAGRIIEGRRLEQRVEAARAVRYRVVNTTSTTPASE